MIQTKRGIAAMTYTSKDGIWKTVLIGDAAVGKTSIRRKYLGEGFVTSHIATLGVDFAQKYVHHEGETHRMIIWDLSGQASFESVRRHYYHGCSSIILVYSITDRESFFNSSRWLVEAFKYVGKLPPTAIIANKIDLRSEDSNENLISTQEGLEFIRYFKEKMDVSSIFLETSAKTGENIQEAFVKLLNMMMEEETKT
ncbi:MAG: GTP-binding protein [Candidatus Thorarchaeota archaeon]|nr:MAG: GTP-binding protein [Candidatus Thorarchaeota archaeon]